MTYPSCVSCHLPRLDQGGLPVLVAYIAFVLFVYFLIWMSDEP